MDFEKLASPDRIKRALAAATKRGIKTQLLQTRGDALTLVRSMIPEGATLMCGASVTLKEIGLEDLLASKQHPWRNLKDAVTAEQDPLKRALLRGQATLADWYLGSVHAITEDGRLVIASATGSQLPAYAFSSPNVLWVGGAQKLVGTLDDAFERIRTYIVPREEAHMRELSGGKIGTMIGKMLIFEGESPLVNRNLNLILVNEALGF